MASDKVLEISNLGLTPQIGLKLRDLQKEVGRFGRRGPPEKIKELIKTLCGIKPLKLSEIGELLRRNPKYLRDRYLMPMLEAGELEHKYTENPAHPQQAYITKEKV